MDNKKKNNESLSDASISFSKIINKIKQKKEIEHSKNSIKSVSNYVISKDDRNLDKTLEVEAIIPDSLRNNVKGFKDSNLISDIESKKKNIDNIKRKIIERREIENNGRNIPRSKREITTLFNRFHIDEDKISTPDFKNKNDNSNFLKNNKNTNTIENIILNNNNKSSNFTVETPFIGDYANDIFTKKDVDFVINETLNEATSENNYVSPLRNNNRKNIYNFPTLELLNDYNDEDYDVFDKKADVRENVEKLIFLFNNFNLNCKIVGYNLGTSIVLYEVSIESNKDIVKLKNLENNIKETLEVNEIRFQIPIPGKNLIGIEIPINKKKIISLKETYSMLMRSNDSLNWKNKYGICIGQDLFGNAINFNLVDYHNLLITGLSGSGKSVLINSIIVSLLMKYDPKILKFVFIDTNINNFDSFSNIPHLISKPILDINKSKSILFSLSEEVDKRNRLFSSSMSKNILEYNLKNSQNKLPSIVVFLNDLSDLIIKNINGSFKRNVDIENLIAKLATRGGRTGIYLIVSTENVSANVITNLIRKSFRSKIAFALSSQIDSKVILDYAGAEKLTSKGDMLISINEEKPFRAQSNFISDDEINKIVNFINNYDSFKTDVDFKVNDANTEVFNIGNGINSFNKNNFYQKNNNYEKKEIFDFENPLIANSFNLLCSRKLINIGIIIKNLNVDKMVARKIISTLLEMDVIKRVDLTNYVPKDGVCEL